MTLYGEDIQSASPIPKTASASLADCEKRENRAMPVLYEYKAEDGSTLSSAACIRATVGRSDDVRRTTSRLHQRVFRQGNRAPLLDDARQCPLKLNNVSAPNADCPSSSLRYGEHAVGVPKRDLTYGMTKATAS